MAVGLDCAKSETPVRDCITRIEDRISQTESKLMISRPEKEETLGTVSVIDSIEKRLQRIDDKLVEINKVLSKI
jgi:hypothetical protein